uniref:hypothetical protein n=1 Tax=Lunatimonas salinarum TaxID=1774590 RepID=UPI001AE09863
EGDDLIPSFSFASLRLCVNLFFPERLTGMLKISGLTPLGGCWEYADSTKMTGLRHFGLVEDFATGIFDSFP